MRFYTTTTAIAEYNNLDDHSRSVLLEYALRTHRSEPFLDAVLMSMGFVRQKNNLWRK